MPPHDSRSTLFALQEQYLSGWKAPLRNGETTLFAHGEESDLPPVNFFWDDKGTVRLSPFPERLHARRSVRYAFHQHKSASKVSIALTLPLLTVTKALSPLFFFALMRLTVCFTSAIVLTAVVSSNTQLLAILKVRLPDLIFLPLVLVPFLNF